MGKLKKRLQIKKKHAKRMMRRKPNAGNGKTAEQQAKEVEMLKTMLSRTQPQIVGQAQQKQEEQTKIEQLNKMYSNYMKEAQTLRSRANELTTLKDQGKQEVQEVKGEIKHQEEVNKQREENVQNKEDAEERLKKEKEKGDKLTRVQKKYDKRTQEGQHHQKMMDMDDKISDTMTNIRKKEQEIEDNTMLHELNKKRKELEIAQEREKALDAIIASPEFKEPNIAYKEACKNALLSEERRKMNEAIIQKQIETQKLESETKAYEEYWNSLHEGKPIPTMVNGKPLVLFGKPVYKMGSDGKPLMDTTNTEWNKYNSQLATQMKNKLIAENNLAIERAKVDDANKMIQEASTLEIEAQSKQRELASLKRYTESDAFKRNMLDLESKRNEARTKQMENNIAEQTLEYQKKIADYGAQIVARETFDPSNANPEAIQTQMRELQSQAETALRNTAEQQQHRIDHEKRKLALDTAIENVLSRYQTKNDRDLALDNLLTLIGRKTENKLTTELKEYDPANMDRSIEFINMIGKLAPEILTSQDSFDGFMAHDDFKNFKWEILDQVLP